jgi:hypothetical protein
MIAEKKWNISRNRDVKDAGNPFVTRSGNSVMTVRKIHFLTNREGVYGFTKA